MPGELETLGSTDSLWREEGALSPPLPVLPPAHHISQAGLRTCPGHLLLRMIKAGQRSSILSLLNVTLALVLHINHYPSHSARSRLGCLISFEWA